MCGKIDEFGRIMQYGRGGKYYLRRLNDKYDSNPSLNYVDYFCEGKKTKNFTKSFLPLHIMIGSHLI